MFGEGTELLASFYELLQTELPGAWEVMQDIQSCWNPNVLSHTWVMPDGHTSHVKVMVEEDRRVEIDELDHASFTYRTFINAPSEYGISLAANVTHSVDSYVVRQVTRMMKRKGYPILHVHDEYSTSPLFMQYLRECYVEILAQIAESNMLQDILRQITGDHSLEVIKAKGHEKLPALIRQANYALS